MKVGDKVKVVTVREPEDFMEDYMVQYTNVYVGEYGIIIQDIYGQYVVKFDNDREFTFFEDELQLISSHE